MPAYVSFYLRVLFGGQHGRAHHVGGGGQAPGVLGDRLEGGDGGRKAFLQVAEEENASLRRNFAHVKSHDLKKIKVIS